MSYSDDYTSPATPFSGDETGDIFGTPDVVSNSPTTSERVVDTQSGFLVVIRKVDSRVALSVKRRLGTPPVSQILLTPDESRKLSRILAGSPEGDKGIAGNVSPEVDRWLDGVTAREKSRARKQHQQPEYTAADEAAIADDLLLEARQRDRMARKRRGGLSLKLGRPQLLVLGACLIAGPICGWLIFNVMPAKHQTQTVQQQITAAQEITEAKVDKFVRTFVSEMLDFNPKTYRGSQVHAMAAMTPELMERYWQETSFPLSKDQLASSPHGQTLMITKVKQEVDGSNTHDVDLFAELVSADSKVSSPVHLHLKLATTDDGQFRVLDQKDLSTSK